MSAINSVSAVFDVVKAARRVATAKTLERFLQERTLLNQTLATLDRVEGKAESAKTSEPAKKGRSLSAATRRKMSASAKVRAAREREAKAVAEASPEAVTTAAGDATVETQQAARTSPKKRSAKKRAKKAASKK